ncbi:MAG: FtsX-like permease family protein [Gammaproteobacteria bacterium]|nr:MAG: FtsX-like permease family protein [Gammaproteobacteria bacterium]
MNNWITQVVTVTGMNIRSLPQRWGSTMVAVVGIAGVVMVMVGILSIAAGLVDAMTDKAPKDIAIVLRAASTGEMDSIMSRDDVTAISEAPGIARIDGKLLISPELFVIVDVLRRSTGTASNVPMRGVDANVLAVRDNVRITEGRMFEAGLNEIIVGRGAQEIFEGIELGDTPRWGNNTWTVVGVMEADGGMPESEIWADVRVLQAAQNRGSTIQAVRVKLESIDVFDSFKDFLTADPRINVSVKTESEFYSEQSRFFSIFINTIGIFVGVMMGLGAIFGAVNTMYTAVSARTGEIATLRALGFGASPVVFSVLVESLLIGLAGGLIGAALAYLIFNGFKISTMNFQSFSQVTFSFAVTPALLKSGVIYALLMGFLGGFLPSIRASRLSISTALREL